MANEIYQVSWWGNPIEGGWGGIYYSFAFPSEVPSLLIPLKARSAYYENVAESTDLLQALENCQCQTC